MASDPVNAATGRPPDGAVPAGDLLETEAVSSPFRELTDLLAPRSIRSKLIISLLLIAVLGSLATMEALYSLSKVEDKIKIIESYYEVSEKILEARRNEKNYLLYGNVSDLTNALNYLEEVQSSLESALQLGKLPSSQTTPAPKTALATYINLLQQLRWQYPSPERLNQLKDELRLQGHVITKMILDLDNRSRLQVERQIRHYRDISIIILFAALLLSGLISALLVHWIVRPLLRIRRAVARIMRGELSTIPEETADRHCVECSELVESLNMMLKNLENKQNQLVQSTKLAAIGKVTAGIAHEINNPLNNISLTAEILLEDLANLDSAERLEMVRDILAQSDRAREVVHHLLEFSSSKKTTTWEKLNLATLLKGTVTLLKNQIRLNRIEVVADYSDADIFIHGNANQLQQVFVNIVLNAIQAMSAGGDLVLKVLTDSERQAAIVEITDTGPGIPPEIKAQIFEPFFTTKNEGTGLGLSVSNAIIKEHRGEITLESEAGRGTTSRVILPFWKREA